MSESILFVEDDEPYRATVARHLRRHGYDVIESPSVEDTRRRLDAGLHPSLVLLDLNLPGETGWSLLRDARLATAGGPPVLVASALTVSPARLRELAVAGYLPKPFALETLIATIERLLSSSRRKAQEA